MTVTFREDELELLERAARVLAEHARRDADNVKGTTVEALHRSEAARFVDR